MMSNMQTNSGTANTDHPSLAVERKTASGTNNDNNDAKMPALDEEVKIQSSPSLTSEDDAEPKSNSLSDLSEAAAAAAAAAAANLSAEEASSTLVLEQLKAAAADPADLSALANVNSAAAGGVAPTDVDAPAASVLGNTAPTAPSDNKGGSQDNLAIMSALTSHIQYFDYATHAADFQQRQQQLADLQQRQQQQQQQLQQQQLLEASNQGGGGGGGGRGGLPPMAMMPMPFANHPVNNQGGHPHANQAAWMQSGYPAGAPVPAPAQADGTRGDGGAAAAATMMGGSMSSPPPLGEQQQQQYNPYPVVYHPAETLAQYHGRASAPPAPYSKPKTNAPNSTGGKKRKTNNPIEGERAPQRRFSTDGQELLFTSKKNGRVPLTTNTPRTVEALDPNTRQRIRLFISCSDASRVMNINRTRMSRTCRAGGGTINGIFYRYTEAIPTTGTGTATATATITAGTAPAASANAPATAATATAAAATVDAATGTAPAESNDTASTAATNDAAPPAEAALPGAAKEDAAAAALLNL